MAIDARMPASPPSRFFSVEECTALFERARRIARHDDAFRRRASVAARGGRLVLNIDSVWLGSTRWARNRISMAEDVNLTKLDLVHGGRFVTNQIDDVGLAWAIHHAERQAGLSAQDDREGDLVVMSPETYLRPKIWSDNTYNLEAEARADAIRTVTQSAEKAGMLAAGYCEVSAVGRAVVDERDARVEYYPFTRAQYSVTVRSPDGNGSGWAGQDHHDWSAIDAQALSERALEKCLRSRNPVAVEPGRYTTILEPQAVCDLLSPLFRAGARGGVDHQYNVGVGVFSRSREAEARTKGGWIRFGERVWDERLNVTSDPLDPMLGFPPFDTDGGTRRVFKPVELIRGGVLSALYYDDRRYAIRELGMQTTRPNPEAFHVSVNGPTATVDEMVQTTRRGLLVTRLSGTTGGGGSWVTSGTTRDGLWLIEDGKISKPCKNLRFTQSLMGAMNRLDEVGVPVRVFRPTAPMWGQVYGLDDTGMAPVVVPAMKIRDFNFTSLVDAI